MIRLECDLRFRVRSTQYSVLSTVWVVALGVGFGGVWSSIAVAAAPKLTYFFPTGGQRGQTIAVTAAGEFSNRPAQVWMDRAGLTVTLEKDKGKLAINVAADATPGVYWLRLYDREGASALRPFVVGTLPEIAEAETNDLPTKPQVMEPGCVVNGKLAKSNDADGFQVNLATGQTLVASLQASSILGSPMDAILQVCELVERGDSAASRESGSDSKSPLARRRVEAFVVAQNHDTVGLDPRIVFTAPMEGQYLVRVFAFPSTPDSTIRFAGGEAYVYRLTLTTGPFLDHALPLAVSAEESSVELGGWNLGGITSMLLPSLANDPDALAPAEDRLAWVWREGSAGAFALPRTTFENIVASGLRDIPVPATISGRLARPGELHTLSFAAKKDEKLRLRVAAKSLGFPTDAVLEIADSGGKVLAEADDTGRDDRDPTLDFTAPADGTYRVIIRDLHGRGDLRMLYRLTMERVQPDFSLTLAADSFVLEKGKPLEIPVAVTVRDGLREAIEIRAVELPEGITAEVATFTPTGDAPAPMSGSGKRRRSEGQAAAGPTAKLILKADGGKSLPDGFPIRIEGRTKGNSPLAHTARFPLNLPLAGSHQAAWVTVKK